MAAANHPPTGNGEDHLTDIYDPLSPYPLYKINPLFQNGQLNDAKGHDVSWEALKGKSVALYFAEYAKPKSRTILPLLLNTYRTLNESSESQKVEVIFVSLDKSEQEYQAHRAKQPWLALSRTDPLIEKLRQHFRVTEPEESLKYGFGPRTGTPALLVISRDGSLQQQLDVSEEGRDVVKKWDIISNRF